MSGGVDLIEVPPLTSMPRRKQNYPKKMKGDDSDSESGEMNEDAVTKTLSPSTSVTENEDLETNLSVYTAANDEDEDQGDHQDMLSTETDVGNDVIDYSVKKHNDLVTRKRSSDSPLDLSLPHRKYPAVQPPQRIPPTNDKLSPFSPFHSNVLNFIPGGFNFPGVGRDGDSSRENLVNVPSLGGYPLDMTLLQYPHAPGLHPSDSFKCVLCQRRCQSFMELSQHIKEHIIPPGLGPLFPPSSIHPPSQSSSSSESSRVPRKLVRGQDVWLGKGVEQTKQILKCMWCGQSFSTLAEMTTHMQKTQHYTNILSQEQVVPWRAQDGKTVPSGITCKVCDKVFRTLQELTSHMVQKSHFFDPVQGESQSRKKLVKEKRRSRSLPVRKLLEIGRRHNLVPGEKKSPGTVCDRCECKLDSVEHLKFCRGRTKMPSRQEQGPSEGLAAEKSCEGDKSGELSALENLIEKSFEKTFSEQYKSVNILQKLGLDSSEILMSKTPLFQSNSPIIAFTGNQFPVSSQIPLLSPYALCKTPHVSTPSSGHSHASSPRSSESATPEQFKDSPPLSGSSSELPKSPIQMNCPEEEPGQAHPLAALQKLCDQTHKSSKSSALKARAMATGMSPSASEDEGGGAFKCAFCDISLISKTCYQCHLADVHFIKDGALFCKSPSPSKSVPPDLEDTPTSKFVKYSELAKQLSSGHCNS